MGIEPPSLSDIVTKVIADMKEDTKRSRGRLLTLRKVVGKERWSEKKCCRKTEVIGLERCPD